MGCVDSTVHTPSLYTSMKPALKEKLREIISRDDIVNLVEFDLAESMNALMKIVPRMWNCQRMASDGLLCTFAAGLMLLPVWNISSRSASSREPTTIPTLSTSKLHKDFPVYIFVPFGRHRDVSFFCLDTAP
jgi:hypothetical protein